MFGKKLKNEKIVEQWSTLIEAAQGKGEDIIKKVISRVEELDPPEIFLARKNISSKGGLFKEKREFLVAEHKSLENYIMYIGVHDYGKQLSVSWYLVVEPSGFVGGLKRNPIRALLTFPFLIISKVLARSQGEILLQDLNVFDNEDLTAYVATVHHSVLNATEELMKGVDQDFAKVDQKSRGFLNIS